VVVSIANIEDAIGVGIATNELRYRFKAWVWFADRLLTEEGPRIACLPESEHTPALHITAGPEGILTPGIPAVTERGDVVEVDAAAYFALESPIGADLSVPIGVHLDCIPSVLIKTVLVASHHASPHGVSTGCIPVAARSTGNDIAVGVVPLVNTKEVLAISLEANKTLGSLSRIARYVATGPDARRHRTVIRARLEPTNLTETLDVIRDTGRTVVHERSITAEWINPRSEKISRRPEGPEPVEGPELLADRWPPR
jgi:hypothetical protein